MNKFVLCVCVLFAFGAAGARADELPDRPPSLIPYSSQSVTQPLWTGFYIGGNGGYGWLNTTATFLPNDPAAATRGQNIPQSSLKVDGATAGGQIGYNWQVNLWVFGIEADYQWDHFKGTTSTPFSLSGVGTAQAVINQSTDSFGTVRGRFGFVPATPLLLYATGGLAYARFDQNITVSRITGSGSVTSGGFNYSCSAGMPTCFAGSSSKEVFGWTLGAGGEYLITNNFSFKTEFLYLHFSLPGATVYAQNTVAGKSPASFAAAFGQQSFAIVRAGFNFKF